MELIRGLSDLLRNKKPCAVTIGNFDGVHLGHQAVLEQLKSSIAGTELISTVLIFEPQPTEFFFPEKAPSRLTRLREKLQQLAKHDIDRVVCLRFDEKLANVSPAEFVEDVLLDALVMNRLIVGDDFRFAKDREGDFRYLIEAGKKYNFDVRMTESFYIDHERVSSTLIRKVLATGDMSMTTRLLGRPYRIVGRVVHGDKRGRSLGFATANIALHRYFSPVEGIFSGQVYGIDNASLDAVIYVGSRPMYDGDRVLLEVHILDFDADLYGKHLEIEFLEKLRGESKFASEAELVHQIKEDIRHARQSLNALKKIN